MFVLFVRFSYHQWLTEWLEEEDTHQTFSVDAVVLDVALFLSLSPWGHLFFFCTSPDICAWIYSQFNSN